MTQSENGSAGRSKGRSAIRLFLLLVLLSLFSLSFAQSPPSGIWAYSNGSTSNRIAWNPVLGATGYRLYASQTPSGQTSPAITTTTALAYTHGSLTAGVRVYYRVATLYGALEGPMSAEVSATPGASRTGAAYVAAFSGDGSVTLRWSDIPGISSYRVFRVEAPSGPTLLIGTVSTSSFVDTSVQNAVAYRYWVRGTKPDTDLVDSNFAYATPGDNPPMPPSAVWASPQASSAVVRWHDVPGADTYVVYRGTTSNGQGNKPYAISGTAYFSDSNVVGGTTYYYKIAACDAVGTSVKSVQASATPGTTALAAPYLSAASGTGKVVLNWTSVAGATFYALFRRIGSGAWECYQQLPATTYTDTAVSPGTLYTYQVFAGSIHGLGIGSYLVEGKPGAAFLPAPTGVYARATATYTEVNWNPVEGATGYNLYRGTVLGQERLFRTQVGSGVNDSDVVAGVTYFYRVRAVYRSTEGQVSARVSATPGHDRLPSTQLAAYPVAGKVNLFWDLVEGAGSYNVYRSTSYQAYICIKVGVKPSEEALWGTYIDTTAKPGVSQRYTVAAVNVDGTGDFSNAVEVTPGNPPLSAPPGGYVLTSATTLHVFCMPVAGAASYNLYRSTTPGAYGSMPFKVGSIGSFYDTTVVPGTTYYYKWAAVDDDGQGPLSPELSGTPGSTLLQDPMLTAYSLPTSVRLYWADVGADYYNVFRAPNAGQWEHYAFNVVGTTFLDSAVQTGVKYTYYIYPVNQHGSGQRSNQISCRPGATAPPVPFGLWGYQMNGGSVLYWNPVAGATDYAIYMSTQPDGQGMVPIAYTTGPQATVSNLTNNAFYYFKIAALTANAQGAKTVEISVKPGSARLTAVSLGVPTVTVGNVALAWTVKSGATGYHVFRKINNEAFRMVAADVAVTNWSDTDVIAGVEYTYYVSPTNSTGTGSMSNQRKIIAK